MPWQTDHGNLERFPLITGQGQVGGSFRSRAVRIRNKIRTLPRALASRAYKKLGKYVQKGGRRGRRRRRLRRRRRRRRRRSGRRLRIRGRRRRRRPGRRRRIRRRRRRIVRI